MEPLDAILSADDVVAVLGREVPVRLVDVSHSGCLLQSHMRLLEGTTGTLRLSYDGAEYADHVRVMRCQTPVNGDNWYRIGAQFLWTTRPEEGSLRRLIASLQPAVAGRLWFDTDRAVY